jgi:hypothetical protein
VHTVPNELAKAKAGNADSTSNAILQRKLDLFPQETGEFITISAW